MSKKQEFIKVMKNVMEMNEVKNQFEENEDAMSYFIALCETKEKEKPLFTDNGKLIMMYMKQMTKENDEFMAPAKKIAEGMEISSRTVSGSMRKLVELGFIEKLGKDPYIYSLTENGKTVNIED